MKWLLLFLVIGLLFGLSLRSFKGRRYLPLIIAALALTLMLLTLKTMSFTIKFIFFLAVIAAIAFALLYMRKS